jgi:hypothetical protein
MNGRIRVLSLLTRLQDKDEEQMWQSAHLRQTHRIRLTRIGARARQRRALDAPGRTRRLPLRRCVGRHSESAVRTAVRSLMKAAKGLPI